MRKISQISKSIFQRTELKLASQRLIWKLEVSSFGFWTDPYHNNVTRKTRFISFPITVNVMKTKIYYISLLEITMSTCRENTIRLCGINYHKISSNFYKWITMVHQYSKGKLDQMRIHPVNYCSLRESYDPIAERDLHIRREFVVIRKCLRNMLIITRFKFLPLKGNVFFNYWVLIVAWLNRQGRFESKRCHNLPIYPIHSTSYEP